MIDTKIFCGDLKR